MKAFCIEYWDEDKQKYVQEYYMNIMMAAKRVQGLEKYVKNSHPEISTIFIDDAETA